VRLLILGLALAACDSCGDAAQTAQAPAPQASEPKPVPKAVLEGIVRLAAGQQLPEHSLEDMESKVLDHTARGAWPDACTPPKTADRQPVQLSAEGGLSGVVLAASQFKHGRTRPPVTHEVVIEDCRLTPSLVVAVKGDTLRVKNSLDSPVAREASSTPPAGSR
jgi:hypothetical protein